MYVRMYSLQRRMKIKQLESLLEVEKVKHTSTIL